MSDYDFTINSIPFYASQSPVWQPHGVQAGFAADGRPAPYGPGRFSVVLNALAVTDPSGYGGPFATSGTYQQLFNLFLASLSAANGGLVSVHTFDPRTGEYTTVSARMKPPVKLAGGAAMGNVLVEFYNAFISSEDRENYYGGDPTPIDGSPDDYIPGDPLPPGDPAKTYGWNVGSRWNYGLWGQGEGVA